ncbi:CutA divalent cation tolerance [Balamuthia mandrillaris]
MEPSSSDAEGKFSVAFVTTNSMQQAEEVSDALLEAGLVACVNIVPGITSKYVWQGKIQKDTELLLVIKTRTNLLDQVISTVKAKHSYEVPEVISLPIQKGNPPYLKWLEESTTAMRSQQQ